jgi:hypothetical protein
MSNKTGIALANEMRESAHKALFDENVLVKACDLLIATGNPDSPELNQMLFNYSNNLVATVTAILAGVLLTENQLDGMVSDIQMFEDIEKEVYGE